MQRSIIQRIRPALLVLLIGAAAGCSRPSHEEPAGDPARTDSRTVTDDLGRDVSFDHPPRRIVSLAPSLTESLFVLGADSLVTGVTSVCNYPPETAALPVVGDLLAPDVERILALRPDLVLMSVEGNTHATFEKLDRVGLRIFVSNPRSIDGVCRTLRDLGAITGREAAATQFIDSVRRIERRLRAERPPYAPSLLLLIGTQPIMAAGDGSFLNELIDLAGARNAAAAVPGNYPTLNREAVLRMNPAMLLFPDDMHFDAGDLRARFPEWKGIDAVRRGRLHAVDADIFLRPGPRVFLAAQRLHALVRAATQ
ncbi:MAG: helical backbone metal receptor [Bacteroidota bacterium]|nr:helical backbone metal receptor [Bacteroidota bacterium]